MVSLSETTYGAVAFSYFRNMGKGIARIVPKLILCIKILLLDSSQFRANRSEVYVSMDRT
jgi:hypothetical protein